MLFKAIDAKSRLTAWPILAVVLLGLAANAAPPQIPRPAPITVVEVTLPTRAALDDLIDQGYNIANLRANIATIYATDKELKRLAQTPYDYRILEPQQSSTKNLGPYHTYPALTSQLQALAAAHPQISRRLTLGQSVQGRELWAMLITDNPDHEEDEPEFKYIATMHGNEPLGAEMCLYFIDMLLTEYQAANPRIVNLIDTTAIWIVPLMNPDGLAANTRFNATGHDLNRTFPSYPNDFNATIFDNEPLADANRPPEVAHIMRWTAQNSFTLGGEFHSGALVVNYPYDDDAKGSHDSPTPDDLLFKDISRRYSIHNPPMWNSPLFYQGITNGAAWYSISGGMEDWNYRYLSCNDVIIEIADIRKPPSDQIPAFWAENSESMLSYLEAVHIGIRGIVTDYATQAPLYAQIKIAANTHPVFTDPEIGDYHRMLLPGQYDLTATAPGYLPHTLTNVTVTQGPATQLDIELILDADLNADGSTNFADFALFAALWQSNVCPHCPGDYTGDGKVNAKDLAPLLAYWLLNPE